MNNTYSISIEQNFSTLPLKQESEHFVMHFGFRNPRRGKHFELGGIRMSALVHTYFEGLESTYSTLRNPVWMRNPPKTSDDQKTHVYVFDISNYTCFSGPFSSVDAFGVPFIALHCRHDEPTLSCALQHALSQASHEATHMFNFNERPLGDYDSEPWIWVDEGMAVLMETLVKSGNPDYLRFARRWVDVPEISLDSREGWYQAFMFLRYLYRVLGQQFVNELWIKAAKDETPFDALQRMLNALKEPRILSSADPDIRDVFASGYCMDSYFMLDPANPGFAPEIHERFRERAIAESFELEKKVPKSSTNALDHLACRYYRIYLDRRVKEVHVTFKTPHRPDGHVLKGEIVPVTFEMQMSTPTVTLRPTGIEDGMDVLSTTIGTLVPEKFDHLVLTVSNCGMRPHCINPDIEHDDAQEYTLELSAN